MPAKKPTSSSSSSSKPSTSRSSSASSSSASTSTPVRKTSLPRATTSSPATSRRREPTYEEIAKRAYEISQGPDAGDEHSNWVRAERELRGY